MERHPLSAIIIADGRRLSAADDVVPAGLDPGQLARALAAVAPLATDIVWVAADPAALLGQDGLIVSDHFQPPDLLSAIHAGLFTARCDHALVISAAMPPPSAVLDLLRQAVAPKWDGVLLASSEGAQVLPAVYHKRCLKLLARQLSDGGRSVTVFLRQLHRHLIPQELVNQAQAAPPKSEE